MRIRELDVTCVLLVVLITQTSHSHAVSANLLLLDSVYIDGNLPAQGGRVGAVLLG